MEMDVREKTTGTVDTSMLSDKTQERLLAFQKRRAEDKVEERYLQRTIQSEVNGDASLTPGQEYPAVHLTGSGEAHYSIEVHVPPKGLPTLDKKALFHWHTSKERHTSVN